MNEPRDKRKATPLDYAPVPRPPPYTVPPYRKVLSGVLILAGVVLGGVGMLLANESARVSVWTAALGLVVYGLVIRFQHVRL